MQGKRHVPTDKSKTTRAYREIFGGFSFSFSFNSSKDPKSAILTRVHRKVLDEYDSMTDFRMRMRNAFSYWESPLSNLKLYDHGEPTVQLSIPSN